MSSSDSSTISATYVNGRQLISGLSSGLDVDSIVKAAITAEKWKLYKLQQKQQLAEWRQTAYREIINDITTFSDKYFDLTSSDNILSTKNFQKFSVTSTDTSIITATAGTTATAGSHKLTVSQLATAATKSSSSQVSKDVQGTSQPDFSAAAGKSFVINLDGTQHTVTIDSSVTDYTGLQSAIDDAVGEGKITVSVNDSTGALIIKAAENSGVQKITISSASTKTSALSDLGFGDDAVLSNRLTTSNTLETISKQLNTALSFDEYGQIEFSINGVEFSFDKTDKLSDVISQVNKSSAGVTMKYDELSGKLVLTANNTGAGSNLTVEDNTGNFVAALLDGQLTAGQDAKLTLDGVSLTRSTNQITVDGITYNLKDTTDEAVTIGITQDTDGIYDSIKSFVDAYNSLIATINDKIDEDYDYDYPPLTDDQKDEMTDEEIEKWEEKAKTGILANDSLMQNLVTNLRRALSDTVSGQISSLAAIGITTSTYDEKGKLHIDEDKLKTAIENNPQAVMKLFTQQSDSYPGTTAVRSLNTTERQTRYKEEGLSYRIYDILQDNISAIRDSSGNKGLMLLKAGIENDTTESNNSYSKEIKELEEQIEDENDRLDEEEEKLYDKYSTLETYISTMSAQLAALSSLTSS